MTTVREVAWPLAGAALAAIVIAPWVGCKRSTTPDPTSSSNNVSTEGAGCLDTTPPGFAYKPGCCDYTVSIPEVTAFGFDDGKLGANPGPAHLHLSWAGPTSSSFVANWKTDNDTTATLLLYGSDEAAVTAADAPTANVKKVTGHHLLYGSKLDKDPTRVHEVHMCGLEPSKKYFYKVGAKGGWSKTYSVSTGPKPAAKESFRFAVMGDSRNEPTVFAQIQEALSQKGIDFQLFTGDLVAVGQLQSDWNGFFGAKSGSFAAQDLMATTPLMVVNGNHDALAVNYVSQFAMPQEQSPGELAQGEEWWSFDYGNAHFIGLNDTPDASALGTEQRDWLEADLAKLDRSKTPWVFAMHHKSTYSCGGSHGSFVKLRAHWQPVFDKHKVDVVFSGHDHLYERSKPMRGLNGQDGIVAQAGPEAQPVNESGTVYALTGGAGAPLYSAKGNCPAHTHLIESTRNYVVVEITDRTLKYQAFRLDGTTLDKFDYTK